jgi:hypothetical protein
MCSYITERIAVSGGGKGPAGWGRITHATVYYDHPYFSPEEHTLNVDFVNEAAGAGSRIAVELNAESARLLAERILSTLAAAGG